MPSEGRAALLELFAEELRCLLQLAHTPQQAGQAVHAAHRVRVGVAKLRPASAPAVTLTIFRDASGDRILTVWWGGRGNQIIASVPTDAKTERNGMLRHNDPSSRTNPPTGWTRRNNAPLYRAKCVSNKLTGMVRPIKKASSKMPEPPALAAQHGPQETKTPEARPIQLQFPSP